MTINEAQQDMRHAYVDGASGLFASALVWLAAGTVAMVATPHAAVLALLGGGVLIFPVSVLIAKTLGRSGTHRSGNPLGFLAMEGTVLMILGILIVTTLAWLRVELFFPAMLMVIGGRYLTFQTIYGLRIYWICGGTLAGAGILLAMAKQPPAMAALSGGVIELAFGAVVLARSRAEPPEQ